MKVLALLTATSQIGRHGQHVIVLAMVAIKHEVEVSLSMLQVGEWHVRH